jgi:hypothetical protein
MSRESPIYLDNNHLIQVNVSKLSNGEIVTGGTCTLTIKDKTTKVPVSGFIWPAVLSEDEETDGLYKMVVPHNLVIEDGQLLYAEINFESEGNNSSWILELKAQYRKTKVRRTTSTI